MAEKTTITQDQMSFCFEILAALMLECIENNDVTSYNYICFNLDEILLKTREKLIENNPDLGGTVH